MKPTSRNKTYANKELTLHYKLSERQRFASQNQKRWRFLILWSNSPSFSSTIKLIQKLSIRSMCKPFNLDEEINLVMKCKAVENRHPNKVSFKGCFW
ncbi:hypothetical protein ES332_D09G220400v1 [Gossypium tomentosum]|uniref:Uncharacterized protein n=1 Tax=Gossypium tomentosum TaxID=34277 RepID=A0A5D2JKF9_GOSTO|nr:hypothetical protein ES332_D09G220400v1 [Gossypium tomentosum]